MSVAKAVPDRRKVLEAQLEVLAEALDGAPVEAKAPLSREIRLVLAELEALPNGQSGSREDALAARRKAKQAANG